MSTTIRKFDPKTLGSIKILDLKLKNVEVNKEENIGNDENDNYVIDLIFENIFGIYEFSEKVEEYFDKIYNTVLEETGIYLDNIEMIDHEEIHAWGIIFKQDDQYYVRKPDNTE